MKQKESILENNNPESDILQASSSSLLPGKIDPRLLQKMTGVLSILSKEDALQLFVLAKDGLKSEIDSYTKIGLTRKQYYTRLKQLVEAGLLTKNEEQEYVHTALGNIVYQQHVLNLIHHIRKSKDLEIVDVLRKSSKFSTKDIEGFLSKIGISSEMGIVATPEGKLSAQKCSVMTANFNDMVSKVLETIEFAQNEILLITRFSNDLIINTMLKKANMGVTAKVLADTKMVESYFEDIENNKTYKEDKNKNERIDVVSNPFYPSKVDRRYVEVPFCALVVDGNNVGVEIVNSSNQAKFEGAFFTVDENLSNHIKHVFNSLWEKASEKPPQIVSKETGKTKKSRKK
ncbi:MAG: hypothetical protein COW26_04325 [Nitrosopumilales archaeon CG15_BIG_FIL_POST_REV_8_21_14_020_33_23]|nr:MAG: hypothetical protein COW26_04325 [Nitrosopumilales archaeon CG15_BIG_FIL_POST_REV_8_21_14_020_33_23]PJB97634.1 MAG: hypothetical protein CO079_06505 [Nitrosopumilales archaeon CG_4_9_14_0_8_um_filter_34_10]